MAKRNSRRGRSRKRRPAASAAPAGRAPQTVAALDAEPAPGAAPSKARTAVAPRSQRARPPRGAQRDAGFKDPTAFGERPHAPWHPLPLSEILIFVGAVAAFIGFTIGEGGHTLLFVGVGAAALGTIEVTLREHLSGYRSHTIILALLPTVAFHSAVILFLAAFIRVPRYVNLALLLLDGVIFAFLFKVLRLRFLDARRERIFAAGR